MIFVLSTFMNTFSNFFRLPPTEQFEFYRRIIFKYIYLSITLLFILILLPSMAIFSNFVINNIQSNIVDDTLAREMTINTWFRDVDEMARQIAGRTQIREELERYDDGFYRRDLLRRMTEAELRDAMAYSDKSILGISRSDIRDSSFAECGMAIPSEHGCILGVNPDFSYAEYSEPGGGKYLVVRSAIRNPQGRLLGWDRIITDLKPLDKMVGTSEDMEVNAILCPFPNLHIVASSRPDLDLEWIAEQQEARIRDNGVIKYDQGGQIYAFKTISAFPHWFMVTRYDKRIIYDPVLHKVLLIISTGFVLYLLTIMLLKIKLQPLNSKMVLGQQELEREIEQKTRDLSLTLEELKTSQNRVLEKEKYVTIAQLAAGMAHDFNNIFTGILVGSEMLSEKRSLKDDERTVARNIRSGAEQGAKLISQLLDYSQKSLRHVGHIHLDQELKKLADHLPERYKEACHVDLFIQENEAYDFSVDPDQFRRMILAITDNAVQAMAETEEKRVSIYLERVLLEDKKECLACRHAFTGDYYSIRISDQGDGIPEENLQRIFEPFFTTRDIGQGSGLGLAQVHGILRQYYGHILIDSQPGSGSNVTLYLPVVMPEKRETHVEAKAGRWI